MGVHNPYLERFEELHGDFRNKHRNVLECSSEDLNLWLDSQLKLGVCRDDMVHKYSFALPNEEALDALAERGPLVEIGAGTGYWAYCLRQKGVDILAYDLRPVPKGKNKYFQEKEWSEVLEGGVEEAAAHPDRTLFLCWPDHESPWADMALSLYQGKCVAYVGEWWGSTADDDFHNRLETDWVETRRISLPQWKSCRDDLFFYERKKS